MGFGRVSLLLFLAAAVPFSRSLLFGAGILDDDVFLQSLPAWEWLSRSLHSGDSLLWSPEMMGGFPIAFTQYPFLYPPDLLLAWILPPIQAYAWSTVLHLMAAGVLTYLYCRLVGLGVGPSLLAAVSYQMSSEVVAGTSGFAAHSAFVLPGVFLAVELGRRDGWRCGPVLSLVVAAGLLGGHPQLVLMSLAGGAAYAMFHLVAVARSKGAARLESLVGLYSLAALLGVAGAAVRLIPTWDVVSLSTRAAALPEAAASAGSLSLQGLLVGYLVPLTRLQTLPWGSPGYAGPVVLLLTAIASRHLLSRPLGVFFALLGLFSAVLSLGDATPLHAVTRLPVLSLFRESSRLTLVTTFALAVLGGMALEGFVYQAKSYDHRLKGRATALAVVVILTSAALFGLGALFQFGAGEFAEAFRSWSQSHFLDLLNPLRFRMALAILGLTVAALAVALAGRGWLAQGRLEGMLIVTTISVLVPLATILNPTISPEVMSQRPQSLQYLEAQPELQRVFSHRPGVRLYNHMHYYGPAPEAGFADDLRYRFQAEMLAPSINLRWGIASADGYEQLHSLYQEELLRYIDSEQVSDWVDVGGKWAHLTMEQRLRVLRMLGVRYVFSGVDLTREAPELRTVARFDVEPGPTSRAAPSVYLLENPDPLPRFYLASSASEFDSDVAMLDAVALGEVDPRTTVLLPTGETLAHRGPPERGPASAEAGGLPGSGGLGAVGPTSHSPNAPADCAAAPLEGGVEVLSLHNTEVVLRVSNDRPAYLVTADSYWPGWTALVDGEEVPILRANVSGRAVWLEKEGSHIVAFRFTPPGFRAGLMVSVAAGLIWLVWLEQASGRTLARRLRWSGRRSRGA